MQSVADFFGLPGAEALEWHHAVNNTSRLRATVADPTVHVAVGDVQFAADDALPCLAHPWQDIADLDLETWCTELAGAGKALKLDFGSAEAVEPTLEFVQRLGLEVPIILHANVFTLLNGDGPTDTLEPEQFMRLCHMYLPKAVISLGWSLKREADSDGRLEEVLIHQLSDMLLKRLGNVGYALEIRAGYTSTAGGEIERGAALIFDPIPTPHPAAENGVTVEGNVLNASHLFRRVAA